MRDLFLLDPQVIFLNHGSFGACPRPVFEAYQNWQLELERQPVEFLGRRAAGLLDAARAELAAYLGAQADDLFFVTNTTNGMNIVARSLRLQPGDEILGTDHEYGAIDRTWQFVTMKTGAVYVRQPIDLPYESDAAMIERLWQAVTPRTRVIAISHITSPTALTFPVAEICRRAREAGIITVIDGAHVPGQMALNLDALGADYYTGNCHKWLCAPKGSAFLHVRREHHATIEPQVISWGWLPPWGDDGSTVYGSFFDGAPVSTLVQHNQWQGTRDIAAYLTVPAAIEFQAQHNWDDVRRECHALARETGERVAALTGMPVAVPDDAHVQMMVLPLPLDTDVFALGRRLYSEYRIEIPAIMWNDRPHLRVAIQGYNTRADADALLAALEKLLPA